MYFDKYKPSFLSRGHVDRDQYGILYQLRWNILPIAAMLILLGWVSLQAGNMIDESRQAPGDAVGLVE